MNGFLININFILKHHLFYGIFYIHIFLNNHYFSI
jgi:hypothetical protein